MRVLSVDPGYDRLGVAIIEKDGQKNETLLYYKLHNNILKN